MLLQITSPEGVRHLSAAPYSTLERNAVPLYLMNKQLLSYSSSLQKLLQMLPERQRLRRYSKARSDRANRSPERPHLSAFGRLRRFVGYHRKVFKQFLARTIVQFFRSDDGFGQLLESV